MAKLKNAPVALIIMDGVGYGNTADNNNAVQIAKTPVLDELKQKFPATHIFASGEYVGLPDGQMGNSEVGHTNIGAGRVIYQALTRITKAIKDGDFFENKALLSVTDAVKADGGALHLMGLVSPGGVHSHSQHLYGLLELAKKHSVALLRSNETTCTLMGSLISVLNLELAPRITRHGVLVEVYGEGILILGDSGIGKSELAIELVKRGHRLVADDAVELRKVSNRQIMGTAPENIRHFIELRGIGIVNVARVFGVGAVKLSESLDLVVQLEAWDPTKNYQRTGLENEYYDILGVSIPSTSIPVSPGRNLAVVLETAAINNRQKKMGYNAAKELLIRLGLDDKLD